MKKMYKAMLLVLCAALLVAGSVLGTLAYLQMKTETVTNTFTVGKVAITLDEAETNEYGVADDAADRVTANGYKLIPGHTYDKDPTVHLDADSELCYLFVEVVNEIAGIEAGTTIAAQMAANGWKPLSGNIWYYESVADASEKTEYVVFESFKIADDAEEDDIWTLLTDADTTNNPEITVTAYAVQADGFTSAQAAWTATFGAPVNNG